MYRLTILGLFTLLLGACQPPLHDADTLRGTVKLSGAWALYPLAVTWAEEFQRLHPHVRIDISAGGAGKGMADALAGLVDLGMVSRDIAPEETARGCLAIPVAKDAVLCIMNARNPAAAVLLTQGLVRAQLQAIWLGTNVLTWAALGAPSATPLNVYTRSDAAGAPETWASYLGTRQEHLRGTGVYGDPGVVEAVRQDVSGIGYCNLNFAYDSHTGAPLDGIAVIPIDANENGVADPDELLTTKSAAMRAIAVGAFPSPPARPLYFVAKHRVSNPAAAAYVRWALTDGQRFVEPTGYIPLSSNLLAHARQLVAE